MIIYHGSRFIVEKPLYGYGKKNNDYGQGFYCTEDIELAREWACRDERGGFVNAYGLRMNGLRVLTLDETNIMQWLAILLRNRDVRYSTPIERQSAEYIIAHFLIDTSAYDIISGYRADDSYFSYARAFLSNGISYAQLSQAMRLGNLGMQIFLQSKIAFDNITFVEATEVPGETYYPKSKNRDLEARNAFYKMLDQEVTGGIFIRDIIQKEMTEDELRL